LNENAGDHPDAGKKADSDADGKKTEQATDSNVQPGRQKSKLLKPFVPSEEIPAGQAVDFPADI
jgi:hypothetical protein